MQSPPDTWTCPIWNLHLFFFLNNFFKSAQKNIWYYGAGDGLTQSAISTFCICSSVETILSWTCHVYGPFEFRTSLDTSILLLRPSDPDVEVWHTFGKIILGYVFCTNSPNVQTVDNITFFKEKGRDLTQSCIRLVIYCCFLHIISTGEICWSLDKFIWLIVLLHQRVEMLVAMTQTPLCIFLSLTLICVYSMIVNVFWDIMSERHINGQKQRVFYRN